MNNEKRILKMSGTTLKLIAIITMFIDHFAVAIIQPHIAEGMLFGIACDVNLIYRIARGVGRVAFPIYCFLLTEGVIYTRDERKYLARLGIFALLSEVPFDYALLGGFTWNYQNVYFTLLIGLAVLIGIRYVEKQRELKAMPHARWYMVGIIVSGAVLAQLLRTDYAAKGIFLIVMLYFLRQNRRTQSICGAVVCALSQARWFGMTMVAAAFVPIYFYNGERGRMKGHLMYGFYPLHLMFLWGLILLMG